MAAPAGCQRGGCRRGSRVLTAAAKIFLLGHELLQHWHFGAVVSGAAQVAASREPATEESVLCSLSYHNAKPCQKSAGSVASRCRDLPALPAARDAGRWLRCRVRAGKGTVGGAQPSESPAVSCWRDRHPRTHGTEHPPVPSSCNTGGLRHSWAERGLPSRR